MKPTIYKFTVKELHAMSGMTYNTVRHRVAKLVESRAIMCIGMIKKENRKVYMTYTDPLVLLKLEDPRPIKAHEDIALITGFFNNPFKLKNAIDWRWQYEKFFS